MMMIPPRTIVLNYANVNNVNPFADAGSPPELCSVEISTAGTIGSTSTGTPALSIVSFNASSIVRVSNTGTIVGATGASGSTGTSGSTGSAGGAGAEGAGGAGGAGA